MRFNLVVAVWGDAYIRSLCEITFPSFLNARDLDAISDHDLHIVIYCRAAEEQVIRDHVALRELPERVTIAFFHIVPEDAVNHYVAMAKAHAHAAMYSAAERARAIIVPPDAVFAEGSLRRIVEIAVAGKRALMVAAPRLRQLTAQGVILDLLKERAPLHPRRLLKVGMEHLHPEMNRYFWTSQRFSTRPFLCFWELPGRGWLCRNFHLHPLMLDFSALTAAGVLEHDTIDGEFIGHFIGVWEDIFVEQDSDRLLMFTLTPDEVFYSQEVLQSASVDILRRTAYEDIVNPVHRWYFTKAIKFHADDLDAEWDALEEETGRLVFDILSLERTPLTPLPSRASVRQKVMRLFGRRWRVPMLLERLSRALDLRVVVPGNPGRIGHLALDFDSYIKERLLQGRTRRPLYLVDFRAPANACLLDYWRRYIRVVPRGPAWRLRHLANIPALVDDLAISYASVMSGASPCYAIEAAWGERPPLLQLDADHAARGEATLRQMGVPEGTWFVCVHARGAGYSPSDEHIQSYRNASISGYVTAMEAIVARGGWCIRMGDPTMEPLPPMQNTIDYALSEFKSDWMDVFLCARARFFLGNNSGIYLVSSVFGVPAALANMAPMGTAYSIFRHDISIPRITLDRDGKPMTFPALLSSPLADARDTGQFEAAEVTLLPSSPEDIVDLAREMLDRLEGTYASTPEDERRQAEFRALIKPHHYCWGARTRIGDAFLRKYEHLLHERPDASPSALS